MAVNTTYTYHLAKNLFNDAELKQDNYIAIDLLKVNVFRKHLSELIKRNNSNKRFTSRKVLDKSQVLVIRIK